MKGSRIRYSSKTSSDQDSNQHTRDLLNRYLYHWPLFVLSVLAFTAIAIIYIKNQLPVYNVMAKISIKDDQKSSTDAKAALQELDILKSPKVVENEVAIIRSRPLISKVVNDLKLWVNYKAAISGNLPVSYNKMDLFDASPVNFVLLSSLNGIKPTQFTIIINDQHSFTLKRVNGSTLKLPFNVQLNSKWGKWKLEPTALLPTNIGRTIVIDVQSPQKVIGNYQNALNLTLDKNAPIISFQIEDEVPQRGVKVLDNIIAAYQTQNIKDKNKETQSTLRFIDNRLASLTGELTNVEKDVENYKSSIGLTDISSKSQFYLDNAQTNESKLSEVNIQLNVISGIEGYVHSNATTAPATLGIADPGLVSLVEQLSKLQLQRNRLLATTPESNPLFDPINSQIISTKDAIKSKVNGIKASLLATQRELRSNNSHFQTSIKSMPGQERQYVSIKRQQGIKENLYVYLLQKREEVALSYASTLTDAQIVEEPYYDNPQYNRKYPLAIALLGGLLFPIGLISTRKTIRNRVLYKNEIELLTGAPVICELSQSESKTPIVLLNRDAFAIGEQLRSLRTNLLLQANNRRGNGKVTLFTSSIAGEGKSFVSSNIGLSLAASGKKTIILELDMRKPQITQIFDLDKAKLGLSDFLNGKCSKDEITTPSGIHPDLYVMRSGHIPDNPSELLEGAAMQELINDLRYEYDNILVDSPPLRLVTDALILAPMCYICLYMVRHNYTSKKDLTFIEEVYHDNKLPNMQIVFNCVKMDQRYGYSTNHGYYNESSFKQSVLFSLFGKFSTRF